MSDDLRRINERLDALSRETGRLATSVESLNATLLERCGRQITRIDNLEATIDGKGNDGLKTDVAVLKKAQWTRKLVMALVAIVGAAITGLVGAVTVALKGHQ